MAARINIDVLARHYEAEFGKDACWPWRTGRRPYITIDGRSQPLARAVLARKLGRPLLPNMNACHECDNPPCINPSHLFEGTTADNNADRHAKGRTLSGAKAAVFMRRGIDSGKAVLTNAQVLAIRADFRPQRAIAASFGVDQRTVGRIKRRETWAHIP